MPEHLLAISSLFTSAFVSATLAPGGSEAVLAYWVTTQQLPVMALIYIAALGNTLGAITTWWLGMLAAKKFPAVSLLSGKRQKALVFLNTYGFWPLLFSWLPIIGDAFCFAGGWLKLPFLPSCLLMFLGKLGRYAVIAWLFS